MNRIRGRRLARARAAILAAAVLAVTGCAGTAPLEPPPSAGLAANVRAFLREPLLGYGGAVPERNRRELRAAWDALGRGDTPVARAAAETLLAIDPTLLPATVLLAQTLLADGEAAGAVELLAEPLADRPGYTAGQLVLARSAELVGDAAAAYDAYLGIAERDREAAVRAAALVEPAKAQLGERIEEAIASGRLLAAAATLETLRSWPRRDPASEDVAALDLWRRLARAQGDASLELEAVRTLIAVGATSLDLERRQAALELEGGDARAGLALYERLAERHPDNAEIAAALTAARFTWRAKLLPPDVARLLDEPSLRRGDFATLAFWLVSGVRSGAGGGSMIVSDIVEHPRRREIARMLNLGLMAPVDAAVRRFAPDETMRRGRALAVLLRMPARIGNGAACVGDGGGPAADDADAACEAALRCRLIAERAQCRPDAAISGREAAEALRRTLHLIR